MIVHPKRQIRLSFWFGNNNSCVFPIKKFALHANQFILTEIVNPNPRKSHHSYKNRCYVAKNVNQMRAITMCSAFTPPCWYNNSIHKPFGNVCCPNRMCSDILCAHKMTFQSLERSNYQFFQCLSTCQWPNVPLTEPTNSFLLKLTETRKSIRKVTADKYCPTCPKP